MHCKYVNGVNANGKQKKQKGLIALMGLGWYWCGAGSQGVQQDSFAADADRGRLEGAQGGDVGILRIISMLARLASFHPSCMPRTPMVRHTAGCCETVLK